MVRDNDAPVTRKKLLLFMQLKRFEQNEFYNGLGQITQLFLVMKG